MLKERGDNMKKILAVMTLATTALVGSSQEVLACNSGHHVWQDQVVQEWVPAQTERYQVQEWVPGRSYYVDQVVVVRAGYWGYDSCGRALWIAPITNVTKVLKQEPGCYQTVWRTRTVPGFHRNVTRRNQVWVSTCRCSVNPRPVYQPTHQPHYQPAQRPVVRVSGNVTTRSIEREAGRSGRHVEREASRAGSRISKEFKRIFK